MCVWQRFCTIALVGTKCVSKHKINTYINTFKLYVYAVVVVVIAVGVDAVFIMEKIDLM